MRRIEASAPGVRVVFEPELVAPPRFANDHTGPPGFRRTPEQEARFREHLAAADVLFDPRRPPVSGAG